MKRILFASTMAFLAMLASPVQAVSVARYPALVRLIDSMVAEHGFDRGALERLFAATSLQPQVVTAISQPHEAAPWHIYQRGFLNEERIKLGVRFWRMHRDTLARAERVYGVPPELIVAIIGVETRYGIHQGSHAVLESLLTLTLDYPRRADFFRKELEQFLLLTRELGVDPSGVKGSYAGALGIPQFIASSYRRYAVDFDGDNRRDLFDDNVDAIGSVANFLSLHGWAPGQPIVDRARVPVPPASWPTQRAAEPLLTLRQWHAYGIEPERETGTPATVADIDQRAAALITLQGESGPLYHFGYENFFVITRYNRSHNYAMAVYELARMIRARYQLES
jgi:membrane-bound lytic murein transglycosylase B